MEASRKMRDLLKPLPAGVKVESFYYGSSNNPMHQGNVYTPVFQKPIGIVIDIHGGCWNHGDKDVYHHFSYDLARRGFQVLSLTYSLGDEITQKEQVQDVFAFLHYISKNKAGLHLANKPAVLCGDSAGAQLSLLSLYINQNEHMQKLFQVKPVKLDLQALILMHPVCFIRKALHFSRISWLSDNLLTPGLLQELYGHSWKESQLERLSDPAVFDWKDFKLPPVLIVTSAGDRFFGKQSSMLASLFQKHHVGYELYQERDARAFHTYHIVDPEDDLSKKANAFIENFILKAFHHTALQGS
jgi:acetyl esterase/lipase